jgi:hypothetical protein
MGVKKINYHKSTRFAKTGFREALCPMCNEWVYVISYEDDTRWRYGKHKCEGSYELVPNSSAVGLNRN